MTGTFGNNTHNAARCASPSVIILYILSIFKTILSGQDDYMT